jgi:PEP-CTERM motif
MHKTLMIALVTTALSSVTAHATVIDLNFEGIGNGYPFSTTSIGGFYNGGVSGAGTTGPNYGISFSSNADVLCLNSLTVSCSNTSRGGLAPTSAEGGLVFLSGSSTDVDVAKGFTTGFSFEYAEPNTAGGSVSVYSGLDGTGTQLANINLSLTPSTCAAGYGAAYCPFLPVGVTFSGVGESIVFGGVANFVVFDDVTFGSATPGVPEPATWAMMLLGLGAAGAALRSRRKLVAA